MDTCWDKVETATGFIQIQPYENKAPSQRTWFKILYDNNNLYVFIRAYDTEREKISRRLSRRDNLDGDIVEIAIDSYFDKKTAFVFTAMASGSKGDELVTQDGQISDPNWNPVWDLKTVIDDRGWCAEMKIPLSQLRFADKEVYTWGLQVARYIFREQESSIWQFIPKGSPGSINLYGELQGIKNIRPKRQLELLPYVSAKTERFQKVAGNPFLDGKSGSVTAGLDGKFALTNDLTLDFTINPDFGQVEADPSEVNLTAYETFLTEKRPFFTEGRNIYDFRPSNSIVINDLGTDNLFYSRRIGAKPHYNLQDTDSAYFKNPEVTRILGALKLTGKMKNGLSVGILESVTAIEKADADNGGQRRKESVEPLTSYFTGRVQKDYNEGKTVFGGIVTAVNREINDSTLMFMHSSAYTGGIDFQHSWKERTWYVAGNAEFSQVNGSREALLLTQQSSARYFQRPDAGYLSVDSSLTSLAGYGGTIKLGRSSRKHIQFETSATVRSPGFEINDIGYMRYTDLIHHGTWLGYYLRDPFFIFNNFYLNTNYWMYWNYAGKLMSTHLNMNFNTQLKSHWNINGNISRVNQHVSTGMLRGGPSFIMPGSEEMNINFASDYTKKVLVFFGTYQDFNDANLHRNYAFWAGGNVQPLNSLKINLEPVYQIQSNKLQYVKTFDMGGIPRYLFARLDQKTINITVRVNYTLTPKLSLEYYGQPFIAAGKYSEYKIITNPAADKIGNRYEPFSANEITFMPEENTYHFDENSDGVVDYSLWNPDFNFRQFRSNLVIRWEYSPGSTLFLVWSQGRTSYSPDGTFSYGNDIRDLFEETPHNVFLVKFSYWFAI
ncbi:MAG TPA: DUF5916 domain-containing protein [Bacteroidales bacterium]|nr:DUF5916 domain-containing protein [Bacteroidales bacterium]